MPEIFTMPILVAILLCFFEFWYLSEEMLVAASVILFLTILVQNIGRTLSAAISEQSLQQLSRLDSIEEKATIVGEYYDEVAADAEDLLNLVTLLSLNKVIAFNHMVDQAGFLTPDPLAVSYIENANSSL
jgi:Mg2+/Co2+ transporter CorB